MSDISPLSLKEIEFPSRFAVEVNADCNLHCSMCHHPSMQRPKGVMPLALWQKCADEIAAVAADTQVWFSFCGEPLLAPELLMQMLRYGEKVGLQSLNINTNGMLLDQEIVANLLSTTVQRIVIGIDGFTQAAYEQARCGGNRDLVYANVEHLLEQRVKFPNPPEVNVQFIRMACNEGELDDFMNYWLPKGATVKARNMLSWGGQFTAHMLAAKEKRIACPWAITMMHVFWDGRVPRCPGDTEGEEGVGNAWQDSLVNLWRKLGFYRGLHLTGEFDYLPERCRDCTDWMVGVADRVRIDEHGNQIVAPR